MTKSAICIGVVVFAAAGAGTDLRTRVDRDGRDAVANVARACAASTACLGLGARIVTAAVEPAAVPPPSIMRPADAPPERAGSHRPVSHRASRHAAPAALGD